MLKYRREEKYTKPANVKELLILALERERSSAGFYKDMSKHSFSDQIRQFIKTLEEEEIGHKIRIENKLKEYT